MTPKSKKALIVIVSLLAIGGGVGYFLWKRKKDKDAAAEAKVKADADAAAAAAAAANQSGGGGGSGSGGFAQKVVTTRTTSRNFQQQIVKSTIAPIFLLKLFLLKPLCLCPPVFCESIKQHVSWGCAQFSPVIPEKRLICNPIPANTNDSNSEFRKPIWLS